MKKWLRIIALMLCFIMTMTACGGGDSPAGSDSASTVDSTEQPQGTNDEDGTVLEEEGTDAADPLEEGDAGALDVPRGEPVEVIWGHNWIDEIDTTRVDEATGQPVIQNPQELEARRYAEQQVLEKLNVKIKYHQYNDGNEEILQSVLAGKPFADIIRITNGNQGTVLAQNVIQPLDDYAHLFDEDAKWILWDKVYGHHYFMSNVMRLGTDNVILYNMSILDQIESLKVDGKTKYPADYFVEGTWTWSVMEDYLQKVADYWPSSGDWRTSFQGFYPALTMSAIYSNGGVLYDSEDGFAGSSDQVKEAVAYVENLLQKGLFRHKVQDAVVNSGGNPVDSGEFWGTVWDFQGGYSAMATIPQFAINHNLKPITDRGEAIGLVPFPRPDDMEFDDPNYRQLNDATDCYIIPKGLDAERTELAVKVFVEYTQSYHKRMAGSDKAMDYIQSEAGIQERALSLLLDIANPEYGPNLLAAFKEFTKEKNVYVNDVSKNAGVNAYWERDILGYSLYGLNSTPRYDVHVDASMGVMKRITDNIAASLSSADVHDNRPPVVADVTGKSLIFAAGTDPAGIAFGEYFTASDSVEGPLDMNLAVFDYSGIFFDEVGRYDGKLVVKISDSAGNEKVENKTVIIYDGANQTPPVLTLKTEYRTIQLDEDTSAINWHDDFVEHARDKDDFDIRNAEYIHADLSSLDTTTPGEYDVILTLTDYAGNQTSETLRVTVAAQ